MEKQYTVKEVASMAQVATGTIYKAIKKGLLKGDKKPGHFYTFSDDAVKRFLRWRDTHDLSEEMQRLFARFDILPTRERGRPYYKDLRHGHIFRVIAPNKLKEKYEEVNSKGYRRVKLIQKDGSPKNEKVSRVIMEDIPHEPEQDQVDHLAGKDQNGRQFLQWTTGKQNIENYLNSKQRAD